MDQTKNTEVSEMYKEKRENNENDRRKYVSEEKIRKRMKYKV
jgi:hypothetical protein